MKQDATDPPKDARLRDACSGFAERHPGLSARRVTTWPQGFALAVILAGLAGAAYAAPDLMSRVAQIAFWAIFMALTLLRLFAAGAALKGTAPDVRGAWREPAPTYSILCPLYREAGSVRALSDALDRLDYPKDKLDILFIAEEDDPETLAALQALAPASHRRIIVTPAAAPRTKPKALNYGLSFATGAFIAVYDAEDVPHPAQLRAALDAFAAGGERLAAVQSPLRIDNGHESWIASQFAAEYAIQFRAILPLLAHVGAPLPLGGAGNHFRRSALEDADGWDAHNVTEDADIAYRLARRGWRLGVIAPPTYEEGPASLPAWLRQRTRWIKGHLQTWLVLMRDPVRCAREMGLAGFL